MIGKKTPKTSPQGDPGTDGTEPDGTDGTELGLGLGLERATESLACTRVRATPYDMVILWSEPGCSDRDMDCLTDLAEGLAESTDCVAVAIVPSDVLTNVTAHGLESLVRLRDHLDEAIETMIIEQSCGDA
jgi:hypothetical protein